MQNSEVSYLQASTSEQKKTMEKISCMLQKETRMINLSEK